MWKVCIKKRVLKNIEKMPVNIQKKLNLLIVVLENHGPCGPKAWLNYGKLKSQKEAYHCHISSDHQWIACWRQVEGEVYIEVYYAGSHQSAPY